VINFKDEREKQGYSIEDISNILRIRKQYIIAIEEDNLTEIPSDTYVRGYIKTYCEFLKIPVPQKPQEEKVLEKLPLTESKNGKYYIAAISLLLLLISVVLYQKYLSDDANFNKELIYVDESNKTIS
jgi:cytoskeletal protein RodZ